MKIPKLRWVIAAMLFLATMINYADRLALSVVSQDVRAEFSMNEGDYAHVLTCSCWHTPSCMPGRAMWSTGWARAWDLRCSSLFWSLAAMLHGLARGKWSLAAFRFYAGSGRARKLAGGREGRRGVVSAEPAGPRYRHLQCRRLHGLGDRPPLVAFLTLHYGWRSHSFSRALGLIWLAAWLFLYQPPH